MPGASFSQLEELYPGRQLKEREQLFSSAQWEFFQNTWCYFVSLAWAHFAFSGISNVKGSNEICFSFSNNQRRRNKSIYKRFRFLSKQPFFHCREASVKSQGEELQPHTKSEQKERDVFFMAISFLPCGNRSRTFI